MKSTCQIKLPSKRPSMSKMTWVMGPFSPETGAEGLAICKWRRDLRIEGFEGEAALIAWMPRVEGILWEESRDITDISFVDWFSNFQSKIHSYKIIFLKNKIDSLKGLLISWREILSLLAKNKFNPRKSCYLIRLDFILFFSWDNCQNPFVK